MISFLDATARNSKSRCSCFSSYCPLALSSQHALTYLLYCRVNINTVPTMSPRFSLSPSSPSPTNSHAFTLAVATTLSPSASRSNSRFRHRAACHGGSGVVS
jgi:hypothetical protein